MFLECDYDGKFLFIDADLKKYFGYLNQDFIKSNRLFNLVHPDSSIDFINFYNSLLNDKFNCIKCHFLFVGSDFETINCFFYVEKFDSKIKFKFLNIEKYVIFKKKYNIVEKFLFLTRSKFLIGSLMPFFFAIPWCYFRYHDCHAYLLLFLSFFSLLFLHMAANTFNDYFDWKSGRDKKNIDYVLCSTGGSRAIDFKIISEKNMLYLSIFFLFLVFIISCYLYYVRGILIIFIGFVAVFSVYFYSAPPIHLASRYGLGELMHIICLGPLIIYTTVYIIVGVNDYLDFLIGIPHGLFITCCLLLNEFPDAKFDMLCGKNNLVVVLGSEYIPYVYLILNLVSFCLIFILYFIFSLSYIFLFSFILIPYVFYTCKLVFLLHTHDRKIIHLSCSRSLNIYLYYSIIIIISCILVIFFNP